MHKVLFKGDIEPIFLPFHEGEKLMRDLEHGALSGMITLKGQLVTVSSIKGVIPNQSDPDSSDRKNAGTDVIDKINREYRQWRREQLRLPASVRANNLNVPRIVWRAHTGDANIPIDIQAQIIQLQTEYLTANPTLVYANPICYKKLIPKPTIRANPFTQFGLRLAERICSEDKQHANFAQ